ncbi:MULTISPECIES: acyl-CoA thioesterase [Acetobacter]|uniref:Acyl-CoA thioesterase n=1 Tax=Acetobacter thailandicus TaxID=1502842 RepID=A0ABT3QB72_9PROT|nr:MULTISPECIES: acyl-CoA thioesterase [Acetobacter]MBS0959280.1 acyl-CoA thioesterase [Acetobacter thailandicus]MBS0980684.1 acyl-CoA thioesterase [Acetobacter thailandicus]MBS0984823.1 acyl-CoA thioesterase [Acetobacter thailandicus]MBS1003653.1 acyl-CoA thioesterase [Acetobacter thailandicus]MCX2562537.1 acyl-CoA thioesterase [Acetobacter thailandicus]
MSHVAEGAEQVQTAPVGDVTIRVIAMPENTNPAGDIFGGWIISQMDLAAGSVATQRARAKTVTIAMDAVSFHAPVAVGDELTVYTSIGKIGRTSLTINIEAWARPRRDPGLRLVTKGRFVFVAVDENNKPTPVPEQV